MLSRVHWLPGAERLLAEVRAELPQRDELCGAFTGLAALRALDAASTVDSFAPVDQDAVALAAGTLLSPPSAPRSQPDGEPGRADFRMTLPVAAEESASGTSAVGVRAAVESLSGGRLAVVPVSGPWSADAVLGVLDGLRGLEGVAVIANVATAEFVRHDASTAELTAYLERGQSPGPSRWRVGHFVLLGGTLTGPAGTLVAVLDTYRSLGTDGVHLQPADRLAAALRRDGMTPGGLLLVVPTGAAPTARSAAHAAALDTMIWDNGTVD